ncbi:MAG: flagellar motor switch protein FliN [Proteobacteria bacterium]|nr:flagellar motor switch protein FliN [Pseudomonadota bacterium]
MVAPKGNSVEATVGERVELEPLQSIPTDILAITSKQIVERLPVVLTVELGRTTVSVKELKNLRKGQVIGLDKTVGEAFGIFANGQRLAVGEVVSVAQEKYGVRVLALADEPDQTPEEPA